MEVLRTRGYVQFKISKLAFDAWLSTHQNDSGNNKKGKKTKLPQISGNWTTESYPDSEELMHFFKSECPEVVDVIEKFLGTKQLELRSVQMLVSDAKSKDQEPHADAVFCVFSLSMIVYLTPGTSKTMFFPLELLGPDVVNKIRRDRLSSCDFYNPNLIHPDIKEVLYYIL